MATDLSGVVLVEEASTTTPASVWGALLSQEPQHIALFVINCIATFAGFIALVMLSFPDIQKWYNTLFFGAGIIVAMLVLTFRIFIPEESAAGMQWMFTVFYALVMGYLIYKLYKNEYDVVEAEVSASMGLTSKGRVRANVARKMALENAAVSGGFQPRGTVQKIFASQAKSKLIRQQNGATS